MLPDRPSLHFNAFAGVIPRQQIIFTSPETRMIFLPVAENRTIVSSFVWTKHRNETERRTDGRTESLWLLQQSAIPAMRRRSKKRRRRRDFCPDDKWYKDGVSCSYTGCSQVIILSWSHEAVVGGYTVPLRPLNLWRVASVTSDLRSPSSQPQDITIPCPIPNYTKCVNNLPSVVMWRYTTKYLTQYKKLFVLRKKIWRFILHDGSRTFKSFKKVFAAKKFLQLLLNSCIRRLHVKRESF